MWIGMQYGLKMVDSYYIIEGLPIRPNLQYICLLHLL
jgi:hypothetical protein